MFKIINIFAFSNIFKNISGFKKEIGKKTSKNYNLIENAFKR